MHFGYCLNSDFLILLCRYLTSGFTASKCILIYFAAWRERRKTMGLKILYGILIALGIFIVITLIRAIFFVPKKRETKPLEKENVDVERVAKHLSGAIQIPTVSYPEKIRSTGRSLKNSTNSLRSRILCCIRLSSARISPRRACSIAGRERIPISSL